MDSWQTLISAAAEPAGRLRAAMADPQGAQASLLADILQRNAASEFGRRHGFGRIQTVEDFRAAVPISTYDDIRADIERKAEGEAGVLTSEPVVAFEMTGGSTSGGKLVPNTTRSLAAFRDAVLPWLGDMAARHPQLAHGRAYVSISPATRRPQTTTGGLPIGLGSDAAYLGADLAPAFASLLVVSPDVAGLHDIDEWRLATLAQMIEADDLTFVSIWSPTFLTSLVDAIIPLTDAIAARLSADARQRLDAAMRGGVVNTAHLWPHLRVISCWADGASCSFARRLGDMFPQAQIEPKGLLATEAAMTIPIGSGTVPALTSTFLEFIGDNGRSHGAHELEADAAYRLAITTYAGLYRYDIGDVVRCVGQDGMCPRLVFAGRVGVRSDMVGEKLDEAFVAQILTTVGTPCVLAGRTEPKPHYEVWIDSNRPISEAIAEVIDAALRANPQYAYARDIGQLGPVAAIAKPGYFASRAEQWIAEGKRLGDLKPVALAPVDKQAK